MKLLQSGALSNLSLQFQSQKGQYAYFVVRYSGTAQAAQTVTLTDCGNVIMNWNGQDIINTDVEFLSNLANVNGGFIEADSAVGAAFNFSVIIPCGTFCDTNNIYDIGDNDKVNFKLDFPLMVAGLISAGTATVYGVPKPGLHSYFFKLLQNNVTVGGAGVNNDVFRQNNLANIYFWNPAALLSNLQLFKDGKIQYDGVVAAEFALSNWLHLLEATFSNLLAIELCLTKNLLEVVSNSNSYQLTFTGAGTQRIYLGSIQWDAQKQAESQLNIGKY